MVGQHHQVSARFRGRIGAARVKRVGLERRALEHLPIHLVGAHLMVTLQAQLFGRFEQHIGAVHVGLDEIARPGERAIHVRLSSKVDDGVDLVRPQRRAHRARVADVAFHKGKARVALQIAQVVWVACIGQFVIDDNVIVGILLEHVVGKVRADETGPARHQQSLHVGAPLSKPIHPPI